MDQSDKENKSNAIVRAFLWHFGNTAYNGNIQPFDKQNSKFNPWILMPAAVLVQFCCGSLYAWSVFNAPIDEMITGSAKSSKAPVTFYIAVGVLGFSAGKDFNFKLINVMFKKINVFQLSWAHGSKGKDANYEVRLDMLINVILIFTIKRNGPKKALIISSSLFFFGNLLSALAIYVKLMWLLYIAYGIIGGFAIGISYVTPVSALQKWFPHKRGLAAGFGVCGFGGGSIVIGKVILPLINSVGLPLTFVVLGSCYFVAMMSTAFIFRLPPPGYSPCSPEDLEKMQTLRPQPEIKLTAMESITSLDYCLLYLMLLANILFGLVVISRMSNMITQLFSKDPNEASTMVSINGALNLFGRLFFSTISDKIGRKSSFIIMLTAQAVVVVTFPIYTEQKMYGVFLLCMFTLTMCYGGGFGNIITPTLHFNS